ncbi:DUF4139 domain-containing protein [Alkalilimnicola sp. S0819]|uniref:DUF4139 domain-containing protein n=1 Tax=Alkalilimnicola sp. S0819 TaxID=2613922 RepID=UPI001262AB2F|nr:DUF4139 domain-containing protein [Alkalilimnicola sp. S0819]KAB7624383.1 DUF4139 domain-containing protein [Alkalilimnicola sp. S0819]MPQ16210.1 DUF4139 domain-containing protein [Alkalilimnicola sp. S0819]
MKAFAVSKYLLGLGAALVLGAAGADSVSRAPELTLYQHGQAFISEQRLLRLPPGRSSVRLQGLSSGLQPGSLQVDGDGLAVIERRYQPGAPAPAELLQAYLGREVTLLREHPRTGESLQRQAQLLSLSGQGPLVQLDGRIEVLDQRSPWRIAFPGLPAGMHSAAQLTLELEAAKSGQRRLNLGYLSDGFGWQADYVARLGTNSEQLTLEGWASLYNRTRTVFNDARVQLLAGSVQRSQDRMESAMLSSRQAHAAPPPPESLGGSQLYTLPEPVSLPAGETVQAPLLRAERLAVARVHRSRGQALNQAAEPRPQAVEQLLRFRNPARANQPLPAGNLRVYQRDSAGRDHYIGGQTIAHAAPGDEVEVVLGQSTELRILRVPLEYRRLSPEMMEVAWRLTLANRGQQAAKLEVLERFAGDWELVERSERPDERGAQHALWRLELKAGEERQLSYRARIRR